MQLRNRAFQEERLERLKNGDGSYILMHIRSEDEMNRTRMSENNEQAI